MTFRMKARRAGWLLVVAAFAFGIVSTVRPAPTQAYGLLSTRYIKMSSSEASQIGGGGTTGINTIYSVGFTAPNNATVGSIAIRFCANNPIIGDACTAPADFDTGKATLSTSFAGNGGAGTMIQTGWTLQTTAGATNDLLFTRASTTAITTGQTAFIDLGNGTTNGIRNPSTTNTTFFARIMMFASTATTMPAVASDDEDSLYAGGVALSTANVLNVTAKVQEALTFCVFTGANCAAGGNSVALGDSNNVLAAMNQTYLDSSPKFRLASNALGGVVVRMKGDTLTSGSFTLTPNGSTCLADSTSTADERFGVRVVTYGAGQYNGGATNSTTPNAGNVDDFGCLAGAHKFDPATANTTYGQNLVRTFGATDESETNIELAAKASNTTEAGVYTTKLQFIATATY